MGLQINILNQIGNRQSLHEVQREAKTTPNLQVFFFPLYRKLVINVRPGMSIGPQGLVSGSITPCLILSVMISVTALGKDFP